MIILTEREPVPSDAAPLEQTVSNFQMLHAGHCLCLRKFYRFSRSHVEHAAAFRHRPVTEQDHHRAAGPDQSRNPRHGALPLLLIQMHPNGCEHHNVERLAPSGEKRKFRQAIVQPL